MIYIKRKINSINLLKKKKTMMMIIKLFMIAYILIIVS